MTSPVSSSTSTPLPIGRIPVVDVQPVKAEGRWPAKGAVGESVPITATVFREGHDAVNATAVLIAPDGEVHSMAPMTLIDPGFSRWEGRVVPDREGEWSFRVEGWSDPYETWKHAAELKIPAGVDVELMLAEGALFFDRAADRDLPANQRTVLRQAAAALRQTKLTAAQRLEAATSDVVQKTLYDFPVRELITSSPTYPLRVVRALALAGAWYEIFPRSHGARFIKKTQSWKSGTLRTAAKSLDRIADLGFDVIYLTPIHPIGTTHRKGRNNSLTTEPGDPGSPYAIGSADGGHDAIHPELGTFADFDFFVRRARKLGLEVAIDIALQCSPDHPWVTEHPEWFTTQADGTIAYAENPPKKYQDIYPLNFDNDPEGIYQEIRRVLQVWIDHGVTAFRVDNPHTKPLDFWQRILDDIHRDHPEVIFLSEAFTKPAMMQTLATIGFHQSYTYFTWRNTKYELAEYLQQVSGPEGSWLRPSFWPTTHDILTPTVQNGGVAGHALRLVLAATGSPTWGLYNGYELVETVPRPGAEEHIDNEKYEFKPRNWVAAEDTGIPTLIRQLNQIRRAHPALRQLRNLTVHPTTDDNTLAFSRRLTAQDSLTGEEDTILVVVNLDPDNAREGLVHLDLAALGLDTERRGDLPVALATDLLSGETWHWTANPYVRLDPYHRVAHVLRIKAL